RGADERHRLLVGYRTGDIWSPYIEPGEALRGSSATSRHASATKRYPFPTVGWACASSACWKRPTGASGPRVAEWFFQVETKVMAATHERSDQANGIRIAPDVHLGRNVIMYCFVNLYGCSIGDESRIGSFVEVQKNVSIGARCKIQSHSFVCEG